LWRRHILVSGAIYSGVLDRRASSLDPRRFSSKMNAAPEVLTSHPHLGLLAAAILISWIGAVLVCLFVVMRLDGLAPFLAMFVGTAAHSPADHSLEAAGRALEHHESPDLLRRPEEECAYELSDDKWREVAGLNTFELFDHEDLDNQKEREKDAYDLSDDVWLWPAAREDAADATPGADDNSPRQSPEVRPAGRCVSKRLLSARSGAAKKSLLRPRAAVRLGGQH